MENDKSENEKKHQPSAPKKENNGDDISIDFSKIKGFFKKAFSDDKKESPHKEEHKTQETKKESDEISIDFGKIKNFFKNIKISHEGGEKSEEDRFDLDWSAILPFFKKYGFVILALIPIILSVYIRMLPDSIPATDDWASNSVYNDIRSKIMSSVNQQYPNLPESNKKELAERQMNEVVKKNKQQIEQQIKATSGYIKEFFKDGDGRTYMPDIDPYYWFRYAKNILEKGTPGDEIRNGRPYDTFQLAPRGRPVALDMYHAYSLAYFHRFVSIFSPGITLMRSISLYPVFVSGLSILFAFLIGRSIAGNAGGFFSALMLAANTSFIGRTLFGHGDSDAWIVFYPLLITFLFSEALNSKNSKVRIALAVSSGFFMGVFSYVWNGWWYIFDFLIGAALVGLAYLFFVQFIKNKNFTGSLKNIALAVIIFSVTSAIFVTAFGDFDRFASSVFGPFGFSKIKSPVTKSLWPNVLTTVAELNPGSYSQIVNSMGGKLLWNIGLVGILLALLKRDKNGEFDVKYSALLALWLGATVYASLLGIRFTLLVAPAFSIAFGTALGMVFMLLTGWFEKELHVHKLLTGCILAALFLVPYANPISSSIGTAKGDIPIVNDAWYNSLIAIKQNSSQDAIITSWWDFGHHFKVLAERRVTFDGTTQTSPASHWVGRFFSTSDENEALGILRMLDCSHNDAYSTLKGFTNDSHKSMKLVKEIILLDSEDAKKILEKENFTKEQVDEILSYTHCSPPEAYVIASDDMIGKSGVWGHFGAWNFERADIWFNARKMSREEGIKYMMEKFNYTKEKADEVYSEVQSITDDKEGNSWVAPWPGYGGTAGCSLNEDNTTLDCENGFKINLTAHDAYAVSPQKEVVHPKKFGYMEGDSMIVREYKNTATIGMGATLVEKDNSYRLIISSPEITGSIFTRMFYMDGKALKNFDLLTRQRGLTGTDIYVYKADWNKK